MQLNLKVQWDFLSNECQYFIQKAAAQFNTIILNLDFLFFYFNF